MKFDFFSCMQHKVIVDERNFEDHKNCAKVGERFKIKTFKKKSFAGLIGRNIVEKEMEKIHAKRYEKREKEESKKKILAQERYEKQIPQSSIIINLREVKINES